MGKKSLLITLSHILNGKSFFKVSSNDSEKSRMTVWKPVV